MIRFSSPPRTSIIKSSEETPGSAPERLEQTDEPRNTAMQAGRKARRGLFSNKSIVDPPDHTDHYIKVPCGYMAVVDDDRIEPTLYQPTPKGLQLLINDFICRTGLKLDMIDQAGHSDYPLKDRFTAAKVVIDKAFPEGIEPKAVILCYGQMHAVPVLMVRNGLEKLLIIFDSTSGGIQHQYHEIADDYPGYQVMLNRGTRQADSQSCITDAFEILCRALEIKNVRELICGRAQKIEKVVEVKAVVDVEEMVEVKKGDMPSTLRNLKERPKFVNKKELKLENFYLFNMPEELCFTAQRREFLTSNGVDLKRTFQQAGTSTTLKRELFGSREISLNQGIDSLNTIMPSTYHLINHYLYDASVRHKKIILSALAESEMKVAFLSVSLSNLSS